MDSLKKIRMEQKSVNVPKPKMKISVNPKLSEIYRKDQFFITEARKFRNAEEFINAQLGYSQGISFKKVKDYFRNDSLGETEQYGYFVEIFKDGKRIGEVKSYVNDEFMAESDVIIEEKYRGMGHGKDLLKEQIKLDIELLGAHYIDSRGMTNDMKRVYDSLEKKGIIESTGFGGYRLISKTKLINIYKKSKS